MRKLSLLRAALTLCAFAPPLLAQIGRRWPSEKKEVIDPVTGVHLTFLTSSTDGNSKIYQTHPDWTSDGQWVIFRGGRVPGQLFFVNEQSGDIVQVTEKGYMGMACLSRHAMKLYIMRDLGARPMRRRPMPPADGGPAGGPPPAGMGGQGGPGGPGGPPPGYFRPRGPFQIVEVDLARIFADSAAGTMQPESAYDRVCATFPAGMTADGNMGLDADDTYVYCRVSGPEVSKMLPPDEKPSAPYGPRHMGAGPSGLASVNLSTGEVKVITCVPFQIGHVQTNPWVPGEIVFCWETGGKAPQRTWTIRSDGTGLRPLYPEAPYDWITHEAVISKDEVAIAMLYLRPPMGTTNMPNSNAWGPETGTDAHPTGVGIVNLRTREMRIIGQLNPGDPGRSIWHVNGSADGRWAAADDFQFRLWLIDRHTHEMILLASMGQKTHAADHIHPTFNADGTKIEIQSAMISPDNRSLNICVVPLPKSWLARTYSDVAPQ
jgi:oligogalacturonide lyase